MQDTQFFVRSSKKKPVRRKFLFFLVLIILISFLIYRIGKIYPKNSGSQNGLFISPLAKEIISNPVSYLNSRKNSESLEKIVLDILGVEKDNYAVVISNLKNGERYYLNENKIFETASVYKLWIMAVSFKKIEDGSLNENEILKSDVAALNEKFNIASESAELTEGEVSWPVKNALEQMITISDNYSALLLTERIRLSSVSDFLVQNDLLNSKVGTLDTNPTSNALDVTTFYKKLYNGEFVSQESTNKMLDLLKKQRINTKLSKDLPNNVVIAHKTGELGEFSHDAGIVYTPKGDYIIVIMSQTNKPLNTNEKIARISQQIYQYFTK